MPSPTSAHSSFYRRLAGRVGKAKAVTATAQKIAVLFYNTLRHGMGYEPPSPCGGARAV
jgi:transposase